jgi:hypothetical protein
LKSAGESASVGTATVEKATEEATSQESKLYSGLEVPATRAGRKEWVLHRHGQQPALSGSRPVGLPRAIGQGLSEAGRRVPSAPQKADEAAAEEIASIVKGGSDRLRRDWVGIGSKSIPVLKLFSSYVCVDASFHGRGRVAEWFKAPVLKTGVGETPPWVRIPPLPP